MSFRQEIEILQYKNKLLKNMKLKQKFHLKKNMVFSVCDHIIDQHIQFLRKILFDVV